MSQEYTLSHKTFPKIHCFKKTLTNVLPPDTMSHNFLIDCNTLSHNFYQNRTPCRMIFTVEGHPVEQHIPSSQIWKYPPPGILGDAVHSILCQMSQLKGTAFEKCCTLNLNVANDIENSIVTFPMCPIRTRNLPGPYRPFLLIEMEAFLQKAMLENLRKRVKTTNNFFVCSPS